MEMQASKKIKLSDPTLLDSSEEINDSILNEVLVEDDNKIDIKENNESINDIDSIPAIIRKESTGMEEMFVCNICSDIMYNCASIRPCLHTFCADCLLEWIQTGNDCPMCRGVIDGVSKNHLLTNIIEKYLEKHSDKRRSLEDRLEADLKVLNGKDILFFNKSSTSNSEHSIIQSVDSCPYCHYPNHQQSNSTLIDLSVAPLSQYQCSPSTIHMQCHCCNIYIPLLHDTETYPKQKCHICNQIFCFLLLGSCRNCLHGCLHTFKDFVFNQHLNSNNQVPQFLPENFFETNVLRNYLNSQNLTVVDMYNDCIDKISKGELNLENSINVDDVLCINCSRQTVIDMVYEYFRMIPKSCLPLNVTARPDCHYGHNCRTQRTRQHHAINFNHACPQTKF